MYTMYVCVTAKEPPSQSSLAAKTNLPGPLPGRQCSQQIDLLSSSENTASAVLV